MIESQPQRRWFYPTPAWLVFGSLAVTGLLFLSEKGRWFSFNEHKGWTVLVAVVGIGVLLLLMLVWFVTALIFRRRFQFGIRTLLVLTLAVALPFSWLAVEMKKAREQRAAVDAIREFGYTAYDWEFDAEGFFLTNGQPALPAWLTDRVGRDFCGTVVSFSGRQVDDATLERIKEFPTIRILRIGQTRVTDAGLEHAIGNLTQLDQLDLSNTKVTDAGLKRLASLTELTQLELRKTKITDTGLEHLRRLPRLQWLQLQGTRITDVGLEQLTQLSTLLGLYLDGTAITDAGLKHLTKIPELLILSLENTSVSNTGLRDLACCTKLVELNLARTKITDHGLQHLKALMTLDQLIVANTAISDAGLEHLEGIRQLKYVSLRSTRVSNAGVQKLQRAIPTLTIRR